MDTKMKILNAFLVTANLAFLIFFLVMSRSIRQPISADVLRVKDIQLVDDHGEVRAHLNVEADGQVVFRLLDETGTIRVKLGASESGSGLVLLNQFTEPGIHLLAGESGTSLTLTGADGAQTAIEP